MKPIKYIFLALVVLVVIFAAVFINRSVPIITGYCAKSMCSEVFLAARDPAVVSREDLGFFPISLGKCVINRKDSSVTATILGAWKQTAVFRQGIGATLVHDLSIDSLRRQGRSFYRWTPVNQDSTDWPMGDRTAGNIPSDINKTRLDTAVNDFFKENFSSRKNTRALLVVYNGQIIAERYADGFNKNSLLLGWSMGKSVGGTLLGILHKRGLMTIDSPLALAIWKENAYSYHHAITLRHVLQQATGLSFDESYTKSSDVTNMLYKEPDMGTFTAVHPLAHRPGSFFNYSSGNINLVSLKIRELLGNNYHAFPYLSLFNRIGMFHTLFEPDASGTFVMSSYIYASARDWARFGLLYLNKGRCNGEQLLDSSWVTASFQPAATENFNHYGYLFWLNRGNDPSGVYRAFPHAPADMAYASGFQGQDVFIIPSKRMVVVRLGISVKEDYGGDRSLGLLMNAID